MTRAASGRELAEAIRAVAAGFQVILADPPPDPPARRPPPTSPRTGPSGTDHAELLLRSLSERERQILTCWPAATPTAASPRCYLSLNTVRTHVQNVLVKLGVHSKLEAAALAVRQGLVRIEDPTA